MSKAGRYLHILAALLLPALAVSDRRRASPVRAALGATALIVLLVGVPGNVAGEA